MAKSPLIKDDTRKEYLIDSLRYSLGLPLWAIFLFLLWNGGYKLVFWIFSGLIIIEYISVTIKMNKIKKRLLK